MLAINFFRNAKSQLSLCFIVTGIFIFGIQSVSAYEIVTNTSEVPGLVQEIAVPIPNEQWYLGTLTEFQQMYSLTFREETKAVLSLRVPSNVDIEAMRPSLLIVRLVDSQGVEEVARMEFDEQAWQKEKDSLSGLSFYTPEPLVLELPEGEYRIEISAANTEGKYMLVIGNGSKDQSRTSAWRTVRELYEFYETPAILMVRSKPVYYPLGVIIFLGLLIVTWRNRERLLVR
ncbi:MAG: hypothetical protein ACK42D_03480 [Candidatus Paceibacteria bacterium]